MRILVLLLIGLPALVLIVWLSVANMHAVTVSLDATSSVGDAAAPPAAAFTLPLWMVMFGLLTLGIIAGSVAGWASQRRYRREAREKRREARHWHERADEEQERAQRLAQAKAAAEEESNGPARRRPLAALPAN